MRNRQYAVIGHPISHSLSPLLHQTGFTVLATQQDYNLVEQIQGDAVNASCDHCTLKNATYVAYEVRKEELLDFMNTFRGQASNKHFTPLPTSCLTDKARTLLENEELLEEPEESEMFEMFEMSQGENFINESVNTKKHEASLHKRSKLKSNNKYNNKIQILKSSTYSNFPMSGLSVTLPHKKEIMQYADIISPLAQLAGAANTLYWYEEKLVAENTDVAGFIAPLLALYPDLQNQEAKILCNKMSSMVAKKEERIKTLPLPQTALILGAGGAAAAVIVGLLQLSVKNNVIKDIYVCARKEMQARELIEHIEKTLENLRLEKNTQEQSSQEYILQQRYNEGSQSKERPEILPEEICREIFDESIRSILGTKTKLHVLPYSEREKSADIVINTIPASLGGQSFTPRNTFENVHIAYDLLYAQTPFLETAKSSGVHCITGEKMFLEQGARQFYLWTGKRIPEQAFSAVRDAMQKK